MSKYSKRFIEAGVKLRKSAFDVWMEFAAKIGLCKFSVLLYCVHQIMFFFYSHPLVRKPVPLSFKLILTYDDFRYVVKAFHVPHLQEMLNPCGKLRS